MGKTLGYGEITVANVTEPFTVMLTNEAQQFATDSNRKVTSAQSYYTDIIVIRGSQERTDYTIGNITSGSGITVSKSSKRVTFSVSVGTTIGADTGVIEIPITLDGQTVKKQFSWSCGKQGPQGVQGNDGNSFAWNMLSETNCGKKHWGTESSGGKYSVEDFITEDNINAVKLICTEGISTSNWSYVLFKDIKMLKQLKPSTKYTLSYDIKANRSGAISHSICKGDVSNFCTNTVVVNNIIGNETWQHISVVLTTNDLKTTPTNEILYLGRNALSKVGYSIIKNLKLVEGDINTPWSPSQSDIEGKGVVETIQYYLATSQASGVTSSTSGWSTDITTQKLTADKKYLWNCYQTKYSDGTSEPISTPKIIGVYGDKGTSTKIIRTSYEYTQTNIDKFSTSGYSGVWGVNDATTGLKVGDSVLLKVKNTTKGSDCLIFANITAIPSNYSLTCTSYGVIDNGSDGQDGAGFHWNLLKYSGDLSKQVLGGAGTYTATVESIEDKTTPSGQAEKITYTVQGTGGKFIQTGKYIKEGDIKQGKTYTVSVWCKCSSIKSTGVINAEFLDNKTYVNPTLSTEWQQYVVTGVANKDVTSTSSASAISFYYSDNMSVGDIFYISSPKVEEGDKASPWCTTYEETLAKNLTITPSSQYFKSTDGGKTFAPNAITIKATIQGEINFGKWQYSIDGGVSFADVVSGQKGLTISNNVLTVSKDSSLYGDAVTMVTFRAVANDSSFYDTCSIAKIYDVSDIGDGRNLLTGVSSYTKDTPFEKTDSRADGWTMYQNIITSIELEAGKKYVLQAKTDGNWAANHDINGQDPSKKLVTLWLCSDKTNKCFDMRQGYAVFTPTVTAKYKLRVNQYSNGTDAYTIHLWDIKLEKGSFPTGWTPAPEDLQTAILSTKSEISDVSSQVDKNKQAIEQRVTKTTYQQDLTFVKGDISKANEGLNKWRYEIYPKSLFASEYQGKSTMDVFAKNTNLTPSQSVLINDTDLSIAWNYDNNYIGYALTFAKFSAAKSVAITFAHDDGAHIYLNGKLIGGSDAYSQTGESLTLGFVKGWNCIEVVVNEGASTEGFKLGTTISAISECQLMNCYYGTPVARQSHITNQLVENTTNIKGVTTTMQKVMTTVGGSDRIDEFVNNYNKTIESEKQFKKTIGETYTTKDEFNGLEIGGRNLLTKDDCNMSKWQNLYPVYCKVTNNDYSNHIDYVPTSGEWEIVYKKISITKGQKYILSFDYKVNKAYNYLSGQKYGVYLSTSIPTNAAPINIITDGQYVIENTVTSLKRGVITFTAPIDTLYIVINGGCIDDNQTGLSFEFNKWKLEKGNKATDWTPAPEDNEINGQNLVSNLPSNWEQGGINGGQAVGSTYASIKSSTTYRIRIKDIFPVSGNIAVSAGGTTTNSAKETLSFYGTLYDAKKGLLRETGWKSFPSTINCGDAKYMSIILRWGDGTKTQITPPDISQICLKIERGTSATPFTLAPEDVNGKIVNVETIANQTAKKFEWIVKGGDSSSNFTLTDRVADLVAERINFNGLVKFSGLAKSTQDKINSPTSGNLITVSPTNPTSNYDNTTFSIVSDDVGGRCIQTTAQFVPFTNYASNIFKPGEQIYYNINVPNWSSTTFDANLGIWFFTAEKKCVANSCTRVTLQRTTWNRLSGYITVPTSGWSGIIYYVIGIENPNKYQLGLVSNSYIEKTTSYATTYASSAVNWVTNNGSSTTSLNSMVKKWTDGAVSDTTQINGGWIKANTITASKIAVGDFTNYADINESNTYGFSVEKTTDGVWFSKDGSKLTRDNYISKMYSCEPGQTFYVEYDISNTIKDSTEYKAAGIMLFGCDGTQTVKWYQRRGAVVGTAAGTVTHMSQQLTMPSGTRFFYVVLQIEGFQPFTGTLKIRNLSVRKAVTGAVIVDGSITADKIATDAIKSRNYISSGGTQGSFLNLKDGSFTSPNLSWDANGNLIASNANLSGLINATKGTVGGWNIATNGLYSGIDENAIKIYSATTYDAQTMYQKQKIQDSFILSQKYINHFVSQQVSVGHNIPYWQTRSFIYNDSQIQLAQSDYCINTSSASNYDAQYSLKDGYISATRIYMEQNITQVGGDVINSSFSIGLDSMMGWCSIQSTKGINIYGNSSRALYVQSNDTSKYNALETEGDVVVNGKIHAVSGDNKIQLNSDNNGSIELYGNTPFIDFHSAYSSADYTCRIIANTPEQLLVCGKLRCDSNIISNNDLIANSWVYAGQNAHYTWQNQLDCYFSCGYYNNTNNVYYYAGYHAFYVNNDSGSGMMYINTNGVTSRVGFTKTSDERIKKNFESFDDNIIDAYMNIEPVKYQLKQSSNDNYHFGFKAQHIDKIFSDYGDTYNESFDICTSRPIDPDKAKELYGVDGMVEEYGLRYDELIAPTTYMVQHIYKELESTKGELTKVKQEKADLETRLQAIEAKLGL